MYSKIYDPFLKKKIKINSRRGINLLKQYYTIYGGKPAGKITKMESISEDDKIPSIEEIVKQQEDRINELKSIINFYESDNTKINNFNEVIKNIYKKLCWVKRTPRKYEWTENKPEEIPTLEEFRILAVMSYLPVIQGKNKSVHTYGVPI